MAFTIAVDDVFECRVYCTNGVQLSINTFHIKISAVIIGTATLQLVADAIARFHVPDFVAALDENASVEGVKVRRVTPTKTKAVSTFVGAAGGAVAGDLMPGQVAGMVQLNTDTAGPGTDGRLYLPFPSEGSNEPQGTPNNAYIALAQTIGSHIQGPHTYVSDVPANMFTAHGVIKHRKTAGDVDITGVTVKGGWATRHSRGGLTKGDQPFT